MSSTVLPLRALGSILFSDLTQEQFTQHFINSPFLSQLESKWIHAATCFGPSYLDLNELLWIPVSNREKAIILLNKLRQSTHNISLPKLLDTFEEIFSSVNQQQLLYEFASFSKVQEERNLMELLKTQWAEVAMKIKETELLVDVIARDPNPPGNIKAMSNLQDALLRILWKENVSLQTFCDALNNTLTPATKNSNTTAISNIYAIDSSIRKFWFDNFGLQVRCSVFLNTLGHDIKFHIQLCLL